MKKFISLLMIFTITALFLLTSACMADNDEKKHQNWRQCYAPC